jgi:hypothetical protein
MVRVLLAEHARARLKHLLEERAHRLEVALR